MRAFTAILLASLAFSPHIALSASNVTPNDPLLSQQRYLHQVGVGSSWGYSNGSGDIVVAVIDTGIEFSHPDLTESAWINVNEVAGNGIDDDNNGYVDDDRGFNFLAHSNFLKPFSSHGTAIAGIIGATTNNGIGISGINWHVKIMPIIACYSEDCDDSAAMEGIRYAADMGANIINLSLGGPGWDEEVNKQYRDIINYAYSKGVVVVISAGNGFTASGLGKNLNILKNSPVCADDAEKVLGVSSVDESNRKSTFADYGSDCIDLAAPGESILSTDLPYFNPSASEYSESFSGTSFAAPIVAGIAALVKGAHPSMTNADVIRTLKQTATNVDSLNPGLEGQLGAGVVNAEAALRSVLPDIRVPDTLTPISPGILSSVTDLVPSSSIDSDKDLASVPETLCRAGALIRGPLPAVYYCGADGKRYVFPNARTYSSWYTNFDGVAQVSAGQLASIPLGGNVTYRPGIRMIKIQTDPKVYAVAKNGTLRWITSENVARNLYGETWNQYVDDVPDAFFINYRIGVPISE